MKHEGAYISIKNLRDTKAARITLTYTETRDEHKSKTLFARRPLQVGACAWSSNAAIETEHSCQNSARLEAPSSALKCTTAVRVYRSRVQAFAPPHPVDSVFTSRGANGRLQTQMGSCAKYISVQPYVAKVCVGEVHIERGAYGATPHRGTAAAKCRGSHTPTKEKRHQLLL